MKTHNNVFIHFIRPGKSETIFTEGLVNENERFLHTISHISRDVGIQWSRTVWQPNGMLTEDQVIATVRKHLFFHEWFAIMQLFDAGDQLLGTYCDMLTPLEKRGKEYFLTDLFLDLWVAPDGRFKELDWDEYAEAIDQGLMDALQQEMAEKTLRHLAEEIRQGRFPQEYLAGCHQ